MNHPPLYYQVDMAKKAYLKASIEQPRSAWATKLWFRFRDLRVKELKAANQIHQRHRKHQARELA